MATQLSIFDYIASAVVPTIPTIATRPPIHTSREQRQNTPQHTVKNLPAGFRVVMAPGLTTRETQTNPCLSCQHHGRELDKDQCSEFCIQQAARDAYMANLGVPLVSGVNPEANGIYAASL